MSQRPLYDRVYQATITDVSTAATVYIPVAARGRVVKVATVLGTAITVADSTVTVKKNATAMTGGTITVTQSGSAAGDIDTCEPSAGNDVDEGDYIAIATDGGSTTTAPLYCSVTVREA